MGKPLPVAAKPKYGLGSVVSFSFRQPLGTIRAAKCSHNDLLFSPLTRISLSWLYWPRLARGQSRYREETPGCQSCLPKALDDARHALKLGFEIKYHLYFATRIGF
jgi:hypothetical protein